MVNGPGYRMALRGSAPALRSCCDGSSALARVPAFNHHLHVILPAILVSSPVCSSANCASSLASRMEPDAGRRPATGRHRTRHRFHRSAEVFVEEVFLMVRQAPFGHDRAAARDNTGQTLRRHRHVAQQHARMNGEVVDSLFSLLQQRVAKGFPVRSSAIPFTFSSA